MTAKVLPVFLGVQKPDRLRKYGIVFLFTACYLNLEPKELFLMFDISFMNSFQLCVSLSKWESLFVGLVQVLFSWQIKLLVGFNALFIPMLLFFHVPLGFQYVCLCV